eukprot:m.46954 g.46954  ORF g.46954 m.46954 type:complete len:233 (+) comp8812_c0_seq2:72-770(+)
MAASHWVRALCRSSLQRGLSQGGHARARAATWGVDCRWSSSAASEGAAAVAPLKPEDPYHSLIWNRDAPVVNREQNPVPKTHAARARSVREYRDTVSALRIRFAEEVKEKKERDLAAVQDIQSEIEARKIENARIKSERREARIKWQAKLEAEALKEQAVIEKQRKQRFKHVLEEGKAAAGITYLNEKERSAEFLPVDEDSLDSAIQGRIDDEVDFNVLPQKRTHDRLNARP